MIRFFTAMAVAFGAIIAAAVITGGWAATFEWERDMGPLLFAIGSTAAVGLVACCIAASEASINRRSRRTETHHD